MSERDQFTELLKRASFFQKRMNEHIVWIEQAYPLGPLPPAPWHRRFRRKVSYRVERARIRVAEWVYPGDIPESEW